MTKLSDTQLVILGAAAQRADLAFQQADAGVLARHHNDDCHQCDDADQTLEHALPPKWDNP